MTDTRPNLGNYMTADSSRASAAIYAQIDQHRLAEMAMPLAGPGDCTMNRLREQLADCLRVRRSLGYKLVEHEGCG